MVSYSVFLGIMSKDESLPVEPVLKTSGREENRERGGRKEGQKQVSYSRNTVEFWCASYLDFFF